MVKIGDYFHPMRGDPRGSLSVGVREANHTFGCKLLSLFFLGWRVHSYYYTESN